MNKALALRFVDLRKTKKGLFYRTIIIYVDGVLEHVIDEILIWFDEIIKDRKHL
jgi:hypothetical protein